MKDRKDGESALRLREGIQQPPSVNPLLLGTGNSRRKKLTVDEYVSGILEGSRAMLSRAITLVESSLPRHYEKGQEIISRCLPYCTESVRIGITGVPGAGKSTFIETFGLHLTGSGKKLAVLAIDPSSEATKGSILGDKTRMERLSNDASAFIRPSPSAGTLGGVARKTRETIILCEAAGYDTIIIETVGVGQSETAAHSMVDCFLLLVLAGAGDELQGIKRGIMEMADIVAITKADGNNFVLAEAARVCFQNTLHLFPPQPSGWKPRVLTCSAREKRGISQIWDNISEYIQFAKETGYFEERRKQQAVIRMHDTILEQLNHAFYSNENVRTLMPVLEKQLLEGSITSYKAAFCLLREYLK
jgi:LAO/AO transport system kinase